MEENQKKEKKMEEEGTGMDKPSPTDNNSGHNNSNGHGEEKSMILDDDKNDDVKNQSKKRSPSAEEQHQHQYQYQQQKRSRVSETTSPSSDVVEIAKPDNETKVLPAASASSITTTDIIKEDNNSNNNTSNIADTNGNPKNQEDTASASDNYDVNSQKKAETPCAEEDEGEERNGPTSITKESDISNRALNNDDTAASLHSSESPVVADTERKLNDQQNIMEVDQGGTGTAASNNTSSDLAIGASDNKDEKGNETPNGEESPKKQRNDDTSNNCSPPTDAKIEIVEKGNNKESSCEVGEGNNVTNCVVELKDIDLDTETPMIQVGEVELVPASTSNGDNQKGKEKIVNENTEDNESSLLETKGMDLDGKSSMDASSNDMQPTISASNKKHSDDDVAPAVDSLTETKRNDEKGEDGKEKKMSDDEKNSFHARDGDAGTQKDRTKDKNDSETSEKVQSPPPTKQKRKKAKHLDPKLYNIRRRIQMGCRDNDLKSALQAYEEAKKDGIRVEAQSFYNLLNLCDGLERSVHSGTPGKPSPSNSGVEEEADKKPAATQATKEKEEIDPLARRAYAFQIMDHMSELNLPLTESAYTAIMRILSRTKDFTKAEEVLNDAEKVQQCKPKLRLYSCLLIAYCEDNKMDLALQVWKRLSSKGLQETEKELVALMKCANNTGNAQVMEAVFTDLAEEVAVPSKESIATTLEWFDSYHATHQKEGLSTDGTRVQEMLREIHSRAATASANSMGPVVNNNGWQISSAVQVDTGTGTLKSGCLANFKLQPVPLSDNDWKEMSDLNEMIVLGGQISQHKSVFQGGGKGKKRLNFSSEKRKAEWERFNNFLDNIATSGDRTLDVVIDGANIGYFKQNFGKAPRVEYYQIDWVIQHLLKLGKRVLMFMHERHFSNNLMHEKYRHLKRKWEKDGVLYKTPPGMDDDWFWLHAALKFKTLVLTNDQMRDHHFQMLSPRTFLRWRERHQIYFDFGEWEGRNGKKVELVYPPVYSRRIQRVADGMVLPLAKRGDENRYLDGYAVASSDEPEEETYLCIRPI